MNKTNSDTFWVAVPGSNEPPAGPLTRADVLAARRAGRYPNDASVCRTDQTDWKPITTLDPKPKKKRKTRDTSEVQVAEEMDREAIESEYDNLSTVSTATSGAGTLLKALAALVVILGFVGAVNVGGSFGSTAGAVVGVSAFAVALGLYGLGVLLGALGEAMLALRDVAVNTRLVADREA